jgi:hypothetical protein
MIIYKYIWLQVLLEFGFLTSANKKYKKKFLFQQNLDRIWSQVMRTKKRLMDFIQSLLKVVFKRPFEVIGKGQGQSEHVP